MHLWAQVWPNLLANALWVPLVAWWTAWWTRSWLRREAVEHRAQVEHLIRERQQDLHLYLGKQPGKG